MVFFTNSSSMARWVRYERIEFRLLNFGITSTFCVPELRISEERLSAIAIDVMQQSIGIIRGHTELAT